MSSAPFLLSRSKTLKCMAFGGAWADATVTEYFSRFGKASNNKGYCSFDYAGVHFLALITVLQSGDGGFGSLGDEQLAWVTADLKAHPRVRQ